MGAEDTTTETALWLADPLDYLYLPTPSLSPAVSVKEKCPEACFASVHNAGNELITLLNKRGSANLGMAMDMLSKTSAFAAKYLACALCDTGCTRLMTLALFFQRQLNILCDIAMNPSLYLNENSVRVALGPYQASREDDVVFKRIMLLRVAKIIRAPVDEFRERVNGFDERVAAGTLEIAEAGRLNLEWLVGISANLARRLESVETVLEEDDWGTAGG